jgi:hypothetical protein
VKTALLLAKAAMAISVEDPAERMQAAQTLGQAKTPEAQLLLNQQLSVETDAKVKTQIVASLATIKAALAWGERLGVAVHGPEFGLDFVVGGFGLGHYLWFDGCHQHGPR